LRIEIASMEALDPLRALLEREGKGKGEVVLIPRTGPGQEVELALPGRWNVSPRLAQALKVIRGVEAVEAA
jgi:DNA polymerase-3 subunit alpha